MKVLLYITMMLFLMASVFGSTLITYENNTIWASAVSGSTPLSLHNATISIYYPNSTQAITAQNMTLIDTGVYSYEYNPTQTGIYLMEVAFNNATDTVALGYDTFYAEDQSLTEANMIPLILVIGTIAIGIYLLFLSSELSKKPVGKIDSTIYKWVNPKNVAVFIHVLVVWVVNVLLYFLHLMSLETIYEGLTQTLFIIGMWSAAAYTFLYIMLYFVFLSISAYNEKLLRNN